MSQMKQPLVSVIIPVYNGENYLSQCLDSVLAQTIKSLEVICVDDGSTDSSLEILESYAQRHACFKILHQDNMFAGAARNRGMSIASGKYLAFLDCDDFVEPEYLERLTELCEKYQADIGLCSADRYDQSTKKFSEAPWFLRMEYIDRMPFNASTVGNNILKVAKPAPWAELFRADFVARLKLRFQPLRTANDLYFGYVALTSADKIAAVDEVLLHYRFGNSTNLQSNTHESPDDFCKALLAVKERLIRDGRFIQIEKGFTEAVIDHCIYNLQRLKNKPTARLKLTEALNDHYLKELGINKHTAGIDSGKLRHLRELMSSRVDKPSDKPLLSIVVPIFNGEQSISKCLDSIINQTLPDIDVVCVNAGSADRTLELLNDYRAIDKRISIVDAGKNPGLLNARIVGAGNARADYVIFVDAGDHIESDACRQIADWIREERSDIIEFTCGVEHSAEDLEDIKRLKESLRTKAKTCNPEDLF